MVGGNVIAGEIDVDSVYLRSSLQGNIDEQNVKTVFQKRAQPTSGDASPTAVQIREGMPNVEKGDAETHDNNSTP